MLVDGASEEVIEISVVDEIRAEAVSGKNDEEGEIAGRAEVDQPSDCGST